MANAAKNIFEGIGEALNFESRDKTVQEIANAPISGVMDKLDRALLGIRRIDNKDYVFYAISVPSYENLALDMAELRRYIEQQKEIIIYYEKAVTDDPKKKE